MPSPDPHIPLERLLEAAKARVAETSLRVAAAEIGMEFSGLSKLLAGTKPHPGTIRKLTRWYLKRAALGDDPAAAEDAQAALAILVRHLPPTKREGAIAKLRAALYAITAQEGETPPRWSSQGDDENP